MTEDLQQLKSWIGKKEVIEERAAVGRVQGLAALLDNAESPKECGPVGPMGHWCYFKPRVRQSEIGPDGHPKRGGFMPPVPLPRRMFGGFRTTYHQPLVLGEMMRKEAVIENVDIKDGRTGKLVICTVKNRFSGENGLSIEEEQDYIYRNNPPAASDNTGGNSGETGHAPDDFVWSQEITPDPVMLFRYSACTFNGHRIHYDHKYVTEVEGYPGLIVQGPLIATFLMELAIANNPDAQPKTYSFQARSPLFCNEPFKVVGKPTADGCDVWSITPRGTLSATGHVTFA